MPTIQPTGDQTFEARSVPDPLVRHLQPEDWKWALSEGWSDFRAKRGDLIVVGLLYPLVALIAAAITLNDRLLPLLFPLVAGLSIMGPAVASGFYELARRRESGLDASWPHFLDPLRDHRRGTLIKLTLVLAAVFVVWVATAWTIYGVTVRPLEPVGLGGFLQALFQTRQGWAMIALGNLAGAIFAIVTFVLSLVSFPLVVDRPVAADRAIATSLRAVRENPALMVQWGLRVALLLALGSLPIFMGLAVVLPVLGYATWHLYTRLVERPGS